jgi:hypothetical protein
METAQYSKKRDRHSAGPETVYSAAHDNRLASPLPACCQAA